MKRRTLTPEEKERLARVRAALSPHNLTPKQFDILRLLVQRGALTLAEISEGAEMDKPQTSRLTAQLEAAGWLKRRRDPQEYRIKVAALVEDRKQRVHQIAAELETMHPAPAA